MSFPTTSYIPTSTIRDILKGVIADTGPVPVKVGGTDVLKIALYGDTSFTATIDSDPAYYGGTGYGGEVTGTNWTVPQALTTPTVTLVAGVGVMLDAVDVSVASTTLATAIKGCCVYDDTASVGGKAILAVIYFGSGSGYTTNNGTFGVTWDANGLWRITLHN